MGALTSNGQATLPTCGKLPGAPSRPAAPSSLKGSRRVARAFRLIEVVVATSILLGVMQLGKRARGTSSVAGTRPTYSGVKIVFRLLGRRGVPTADEGVTIVEVTVALLVVMVAAMALAMVLTNGVLAVGLSQQSQSASNLAASVVAEAEALPWSTLKEGLSSGDGNLAVDEGTGGNVGPALHGGYYCYEGMPLFVHPVAPPGTPSPLSSATGAPQCPVGAQQGASQWPWQNPNWSTGSCYPGLGAEVASEPNAPLASHAICVKINGTDFTVVVYPTVFRTSAYPPTAIEVSVVVTWSNGTSPVTGRTRVTNTVVITQCRVNGGTCPQ